MAGSCPAPPNQQAVAVAGSLTFQHLIWILAWICFGISFLLWLVIVIPHLKRYNAPNEQRQIFRIIATPLVFSVFSVMSIHLYGAAGYLEPIPSLYEAFALASLFLLYVNFVAPEAHNREEFFHNLEYKKNKAGEIVPGGSLRWFRRTWRTVFFYVVIYTILIIIGEITLAFDVGCATSAKPKFAHIWLQVLELIATVWAVLAVIRFQRRMKAYMINRKALPKLITFKLYILLTTLQHFIFNILKSRVHGSERVTYQDITIGIPCLLISFEGVVFMVVSFFLFHSKEYRAHESESRNLKGMGGALLHAINPMDLIRGIGLAFTSYRHSTPRPQSKAVDEDTTANKV